MKTLNWKTTKQDRELIHQIALRADRLLPVPQPMTETIMDITAIHANGAELDLGKLLKAPEFDFIHDIAGIINHINRRNGKLTNCFVPRCAKT